MNKPIYLDYNATTPIDPEAVEVMRPYLEEHFGNPSSSHPYGVQARRAVEAARAQVADLLGCRPDEVVFTSGGTESNNMAIKGVARAYRAKGQHLITSAVEHPAVINVCRYLETEGYRLTVLPVDAYGLIDPADVERAIRPDTILISLMHANNEVGAIQPLADVAAIARRHDVLVHTDAAQSVGKRPVRVDELGVDLLSVAGHKLYAPKGVGALYVRGGVELTKFMGGADQEGGRRAGTENVLEIVGLGQACQVARRDLADSMAHMQAMSQRLYRGLAQGLDGDDFRLNGPLGRDGGLSFEEGLRLPNTLSLSFRGVAANRLLSEIGDRVAASAGSACHADSVSVSGVLEAMGVPLDYAMGTVRFSVGKMTTADEIDRALAVILPVVRRLQAQAE